MQTYPEPSSSIGDLSVLGTENSVLRLRSGSGTILEVAAYAEIGWSFEIRYDLSAATVRRQPWTGVQETLAHVPLMIEQSGESIVVRSILGLCIIDRATGAFRLSGEAEDYFVTDAHPFRSHQKPVEIFEGIMSLKVTNFTERAPFAPKGTTFSTRMTRFCYPRPEGLVLGLPGQSGEMNRNGYRFELYNTDEYLHIPSRKPLYQSWPILFHRDPSGQGWVCVFHDNPTRTFVDIGDFYPSQTTFESIDDNTRVYVMHGTTLPDVCHRLSLLLGPSAFPPLWAFGYQQCRWSYMNSGEVRDVVKRMRQKDIPLDAIYYDIDYMDGFRVFTVHPQTFADMTQCIADVRAEGVRSVCIVDPGVKVDPDYSVYAELLTTASAVKNQDGAALEIKVWPGRSVLPDFGDGETRDWWASLQKQWLTQYPFDGIWNDMNEPSNFDGGNALVSSGFTERGPMRQEHNLYGYHMALASALGWEKQHPGQRSLVISRSGYPGLQRFAVVWHGDNHAWWEHMRWCLDTCIQYSLAGAFYTGADIPGFTGNPSDDLAVRFFQLGIFLPLFRGHSIFFSKDKEPYAYGRRANGLIKKAILLRYSLLREWYSQFERCVREGMPPMLPVLTSDGVLVRDHILLFDKFLVAPVMERDQVQKLIYLPEGDWYALGRQKRRIKGGRFISIRVKDDTIPIYVRAGSIIVRNEPVKNTEETFRAPESYEIYPDATGQAAGYWYDDDGSSIVDSQAKRLRLLWRDGQVIRETL